MSKEMKMADYFVLNESIGFPAYWGDGKCMAASHAIKNHDQLAGEVLTLRESLRLKEAECETLASDISRIVSAAADAYLSGSEQQHVDHLYRVIHDASGKLYNDEMGEGDD